MPVMKLTKRTVDAIETSTRAFIVYDSELKGFGIRIWPSGKRVWIVEYRPTGSGASASKRRISYKSQAVITAEDARNWAKQQLGEIAKGADPARQRSAKRKELTIRQVIDLWEKSAPAGKYGPLKKRTISNTMGRLRAHAVPLLGSRLISEVTVRDVERFLKAVTDGKTAKVEKGKPRGVIEVKGGTGAARKVASDLSMIYRFAIREDLTAANPVTAANKPAIGKRRTFLSTEEMSKIGQALVRLEADGANSSGVAILRLIILTGARPGEIEALRWSEIDFQARCLRLAETKTGFSARPLGTAALLILSSLPRTHNDWVFPATRGDGHFLGSKKLWAKARSIAGLDHRVRYDARHAVATLALEAGNSPASVATLLGHRNTATTMSTYSHVIDDLAAHAADRTSATIDAAMTGNPIAEITPLRKKV